MNKILKTFLDNYTALSKLRIDVQSVYDRVKEALVISKEFGIPLNNNPLIKIQNQLIELEYLINQHIWNNEVYLELLNEGVVIDSMLVQQIKGLIHTQNEFSNKFSLLQYRLNQIKISTSQKSKTA